MGNGFATSLKKIQRGDLPLTGLLSPHEVQQACQDASYRSQAFLYTPITTILTFLAQLLNADGSCQQAVDGLIAERVTAGKKKCSADTGGFCKARRRLPEKVFWNLARRSGQMTEDQADSSWNWNGHRVRVADGSTLQIADTAANRAEYPLQKNLQPGLHYPVVRILVVFSLAAGVIVEAAIRRYQGKGTGETSMLRELASLFQKGDVLLADRYYSGYWDIAFWLARGVYFVSVISASRTVDFRRGQRLGKGDHLVTWKKTFRPEWVDAEFAKHAPQRIQLREIHIRVEVAGFRVKQLWIVTTLTDAKKYTAESIGDLYRRRWQAELQLRSVKTHMSMERLRCKTPSMVRKEFATYVLAYNSIRKVGMEAAREHSLLPHQISFKHTLQSITEFFPRFHNRQCTLDHWLNAFLTTVAEVLVANRPNRIEPYTCKTRPKEFPPPKETRHSYKARKTGKC